MKKQKQMTFKTYAMLKRLGLIAKYSEEELKQAPCPETVCGYKVPKDLNGLTMDQLTDLMEIKEGNELESVRVILGVDPNELLSRPALEVIGLVNFIQSELHRIAELFKQLKPHYTQEEKQAGVEDLDFGIFGTIDWYARRMGITDHEEVLKVKWIKVWNCALIDKQNHDYERRYRDIVYKQNN